MLGLMAAGASASALIASTRANDVAGVKAALEGGADINEREPSSGQTALMAGTLAGSSAAVKLLLEKGADKTIGENDGFTPVHGAGFQGRADLLVLFANHGIDLHAVHSKDQFQGYHRACWGGEQRHTDTVAMFIELGVDPGVRGGNPAKTCGEMTSNKGTRALLLKLADEV